MKQLCSSRPDTQQLTVCTGVAILFLLVSLQSLFGASHGAESARDESVGYFYLDASDGKSGSAASVKVNVGLKTIVIPPPSGFAYVTPDMFLLNTFFDALTSEGIERLASFIPQDQVRALREEKEPDLNRYANVKVYSQLTSRSVSVEEFNNKIKASVTADGGEASQELGRDSTGRINKAIQDEFGINPNASLSQCRWLACHDTTEHTVARSMYGNGTYNDPLAGKRDFDAAVTMTYLHVKDKVIYLYVTGPKDDLEWTRGLSKEWSDAIVAVNVSDYAPVGQERYATVSRFHSKDNAYSFDLPAKWVQVPTDVLGRLHTAVLNDAMQFLVDYEAAFQQAGSAGWLHYPYVIAQVTPYWRTGLDRQISRSEAVRYLAALRKPHGSRVSEGLSPMGQDFIESASLADVNYDPNTMRYDFLSEAVVKDVGNVRGEYVGYFGRDAIVQVAFYDTALSWNASAAARQYMLSSFALDSSAMYDHSRGTLGLSDRLRNLGPWGAAVLLVALTGLGVMGLVWPGRSYLTAQAMASLDHEKQALIQVTRRRIRLAFAAGIVAAILSVFAALAEANWFYFISSAFFLLFSAGVLKGSRLSSIAILLLTAFEVVARGAILATSPDLATPMVLGIVLYLGFGWLFVRGACGIFVYSRIMAESRRALPGSGTDISSSGVPDSCSQ